MNKTLQFTLLPILFVESRNVKYYFPIALPNPAPHNIECKIKIKEKLHLL